MSCCGARHIPWCFHLRHLPTAATGSARKRPHFGTSPWVGYLIFLADQFQHIVHFAHNAQVVFPSVGYQAVGTILNAVVGIDKIAAAFIAQAIQRAIAEQTAEFILVHTLMAGKKFALLILEKIVMGHIGYLPKN